MRLNIILGMMLFSAISLSASQISGDVNSKTQFVDTVETDRARLIVLADMGNEPDEEQQIIHLLICSNEFQLEGLIAVTGGALHPEHSVPYKRVLHPELFYRLIKGYEEIYPNLKLHADGWHTPDYLNSIVASGQTGYGLAAIGEGKSSHGSRMIIEAVTKSDSRPVHIVVNAGANTLAQALFDYQASHSPKELAAFVAKIRVFENAAQDGTGAWICRVFPDIHWVRSIHQTKNFGGPLSEDLGPHTWKPFAYSPSGQDDWAKENVRTNHGALGALYPKRVYNQWTDVWPNFIEGGGTISWMGLVNRGLTDSAEPSWGGWSGRYSAEKVLNPPARWERINKEEEMFKPFYAYTDATDRWVDPDGGKIYNDANTPIWHWRQAMWNDFKARMDWCIQPYEKANHHPHAVINGDRGNSILKITAKASDKMKFNASGSSDPDGDEIRYSWWIYGEAGQNPYGKELPIKNPTTESIEFTIPSDAVGKELHLILEVWDNNQIVPLTDYRRVVISVNK